ncbi:MAG: PaaI family thioesterase [Alphaproteobacteria bacterium]|jgi:uncharacterized protein (TIGR00369 family)|nr:PaaI family thioesterase [Rhodospirillaceae bacterium]MBT6512071.1 PaaI family thioesterase [Rhodospirillaceae bacterium]MDG2480462.1 PaaI family thioesterase [Alphaproteobacteria bacterium]
MEQTDDNPPLGFRTIYDTDRFENVVGPIYFRDADGTRVAGLRVQKKHLNGLKTIHGGMLTAFADAGLTGIDQYHREDHRAEAVVTVTLNCEFVSSAHEGDWLECHGEVIKRGRSMVFVQGRLVAGDKVVMTCSCVLKRMPRSKFEET